MCIQYAITILLGCCALLAGAEPGEWIFEKQVAAYEAKDQTERPASGTIACIGSSTFTRWTSMEKDLAPLPVYNRAFGGSRTPDVLRALPRLILPNKPKVIVYYCGDNDLAKAATAEAKVPVQGFKDFVVQAQAALPQVRIIYVSIKPSPSRIAVWAQAQEANAQVRAYCAGDPRLSFVDISKPLLDEQGLPKPSLYVLDRVHLNEDGYRLITGELKPVIEQVWKAASAE